ncbi:MAG: hypothetical protein QNJ97_02440 [Myxococcota bacterium]|nr:hypothetical protein [Myxococcota bacterium]
MILCSGRDRCSTFLMGLVLLFTTMACGSNDADEPIDTNGSDEDESTDTATDTEDTDEDDTDSAYDAYELCPYDTHHGTFKIMLQSAQGDVDPFTGVEGYVADIIKPTTIPIVLQTQGGCQLLQAPVYECDPPCSPLQTCGPDNECFDAPTNQDVGTITIEGCKNTVTMTPNISNFYTNLDPLPEIGCERGADIYFKATGGEFEPFALRGRGIDYLGVSQEAVTAEQGEPMEVTWPPLSDDLPTRMRMEVKLNNHGPGIKTWIACDIEDTGSVTISKDLVNGLFDAGVSGYPSIVFWRQTADATTLSLGCVQFLVMTREGREVTIPGVISCSTDEDCPDGQICLPHMICGEE